VRQGALCLVIRSRDEDGQRFRPSDWIERLSAGLAHFGPDRRLRYASTVYPRVINGEKCLVVNGVLAEQHPELYAHILEFARSNRLLQQQEPCMMAA